MLIFFHPLVTYSLRALAPKLIKGFQHLFGPRPDRGVVRQIHPANGAGGIDQEFDRACNVGAFWSSALMQEVITADHFSLRIGKERVSKTHLPAMAPARLYRVDANRNNADAALVEIWKPLLKTPQLGVAKQSPVAAIENQDRAVGRKQIGKRDRVSILVRQCEIRRLFPHPRRAGRCRHLPQLIKNSVGKEPETREAEQGENRPENFAAIKLWLSKCSDKTGYEKQPAEGEKQEIDPWKIPCGWKENEKWIGQETGQGENEADP